MEWRPDLFSGLHSASTVSNNSCGGAIEDVHDTETRRERNERLTAMRAT